MADRNAAEIGLVESQLRRMAASAVFSEAGRMFTLLEYLVRAELDGTAAKLNQHRIAIDVLGRDEHFDPSSDSIVRVEMGRLRGKLREYYATDGLGDAVTVHLPKGRYRPTLEFDPDATPQPDPPKQEIRFCRTHDGTNVAYSISGSGYPLVKAANWLSHLEYDYQSPIWRHWWNGLSRLYELIRYDERGCGLSDWQVPNFTFDAWVEDLEQVVEAVGRERFALLGISQGASVAVSYAVRHPENVSHLILYGGFIQGGYKSGSTRAAEHTRMLAELARVGWGQSHGAFRQVFGSLFMPDGTSDQYRWFDELQRATTSPENSEKFVTECANIDVLDLCEHVKVPTLVLHARDEICIPFSQSRLIASRIPGARLVPLDSRNHLILEHEPAWRRFLEEIENFIAAPSAATNCS